MKLERKAKNPLTFLEKIGTSLYYLSRKADVIVPGPTFSGYLYNPPKQPRTAIVAVSGKLLDGDGHCGRLSG